VLHDVAVIGDDVVVEFGVTIVRSIRGPMVCQAGTRSNSRSTTCRETWCTTPAMSNRPTRYDAEVSKMMFA
jgi:hypothetical protein